MRVNRRPCDNYPAPGLSGQNHRQRKRLFAYLIGVATLLTMVTISVAAAAADAGSVIRLRFATFDPLTASPAENLPNALLSGGADSDTDVGVYIVQFHASPLPVDQQALTDLGAKIHVPLADHALIVRMSGATRRTVAQLKSVRWVGPFHAAYRLEEELNLGLQQKAQALGTEMSVPQHYSIMLFEKGSEVQETVAQRIVELGGEVLLTTRGRLMEAMLDSSALQALAGMNEVMFIERWVPSEDDMDLVRSLNGANYVEEIAGYTGQGVRGEVFDDGVLVSHQDFRANPPLIHGGNNQDDNHGTSTYGVIFGDGASDARARGMLPDAEQPIFSSRNRNYDRYRHTAELVDPNGRYRAVFQSNSWGGSRTRNYTTRSANMDEIIFDLDILITQSQSNAGTRDSRPEAWAKNVVSVGGIQGRDTATRSDDRWCCDAASIGPASDGRIKPDLSEFYGNMYTTSDTGNRAHKEFGGTSGATPAVAGYFGLMYQMWADGVFAGSPGLGRDVFDTRPHSTTARALMINTAFQYQFSGTRHDKTRTHQGWGFPDVKNLYDAAAGHLWRLPVLIDETQALSPLQTHSYSVVVSGDQPLKATMVYADPPGIPNSTVNRINDLTLKVTSPSGEVYWGNVGLLTGNWSTPGGSPNTIDVVENVFIQNPQIGTWTIEVQGNEIVQDARVETPQIDADYALVVTGGDAPAAGNLPPLADAGLDQTLNEGAPVVLDGSGSRDRDGTIAGYQWTQIAGPAVVLAGADTASASFTAPPVTIDTQLSFELMVTDDQGATGRDTVNVTVRDAQVSGADLVVDALSAMSSALQPGELLTFTVRTTNQGMVASTRGTYTRLMLSVDAVIDGTDRELRNVWVPKLAAGAFSEKTRTVSIPADVASGSYFIGAIVDRTDRVVETDEGNNARTGPQIDVQTNAPAGVDLIVSALSATPPALQPGDLLTFTVHSANQGTQATTVGVYTRLVLSIDAVIDDTDLKLRSVWVPPLAAGEFSEKTRSVTLPADVTSGSYYIGAIVDRADQVAETDESNNTQVASPLITVQ